jgi:plasmid stability protein
MSKVIHLRNVPDTLHRRLKARAAMAGLSLSGYILHEIGLAAQRPTYDEFLERLASRAHVRTRETAAEAVRAERGGQ